MINGRLYRAAFAPLLPAILVAGFSLTGRPSGASSTLAPDVFDGARAMRDLQALTARYPDRRPGSPGDEALARYVAGQLAAPPPPEAGVSTPHSTFTVSVRRFSARTIDGRRTLTDVVASRDGYDPRAIVLLAHRDAPGRGSAADLSGTAALLELARLLSQRVTTRSVVLVSTSGGSGGAAGAADFAAHAPGPVDAVLVLGDVAGVGARRPFVLPWSDDQSIAPVALQRTVQDAVSSEVGAPPGDSGFVTQFTHLAMPYATSEEGALNAAGVPAVTLQVSGERGPAPGDPVSADRMQNFGRAALRAFNALDGAPEVPPPSPGLVFERKLLPEWAVRLLVGALMLPALLAAVDGFARARRRRHPVAVWLRWVLGCAAPFFICALFLVAMRTTGILSLPGGPLASEALRVGGQEKGALAGVALVLVVCWLAFRSLAAPSGPERRPSAPGAGAALMLVLAAVSVATWVVNPYAALLLVPALHLWLVVADPRLRPPRGIGLPLVALALFPLVGMVALYVRQLGLGPLQALWMPAMLVTGGQLGVVAMLGWSLALGTLAAAAMIAFTGRVSPPAPPPEPVITVRGPASYAGPGSLGGTESALRR